MLRILGHMPRANTCINDTLYRETFVSNVAYLYSEDYFVFQVMPHGQRADEMQHASNMMSGPLSNQSGINSSFSTIMDETDDYMDYVGGGGSPLGLSSESSNQDRSCTSTPVGNDGSPAGENMLKRKKSQIGVLSVSM